MSVTELYPAFMTTDLANSGLTPQDVRARVAQAGEKQATNTPIGQEAYVLPYFDIQGKQLAFYRLKLSKGVNEHSLRDPADAEAAIKYKQLATSGNHIYFPQGFHNLLKKAPYILITEGEKKAAAAVKAGFACVGLGGVDSWKNRNITLPKDSQVGQSTSGAVVVRIPAGAEVADKVDTLAEGMKVLIQEVIRRDIPIIICYDSDINAKGKGYCKFEVQRAAATLGFELRHRGIKFHRIKQLILQPEELGVELAGQKLGLDDFLTNEDLGPDVLGQQIHDMLKARSAFPKHPNTREYVGRKLQKSGISRTEMLALSTAIVCDMDSSGQRLHCPYDDNMYYFDENTHKLIKATFMQGMEFAKTAFGRKLYDAYGLTQADMRVMNVLNSQFCGEQPITPVSPEKVMVVRGDTLYYQISDGYMVKVNKDGIRVVLNGHDGVLFEGDAVEPLDKDALSLVINHYSQMETLPNIWYDVIKEARVAESEDDRQRKLLSLLYSISPWMYRWRATQLPLEQTTGEAGSGKSTLYVMRQTVISGRSSLKNSPNDLRDWSAGVANTAALHVTDNVHMTKGTLRQQLSDELARVITERDPHIEARKLYSDNDLVRIPVRAVFAVTAIQQPFTNTDIVQRSIITELDKGTGVVEYDADWPTKQLNRFGGRLHWVAHQMVFMQRLFQDIHANWDPDHRARYRLINVEQLLMSAARVYKLGDQPYGSWVANYLEGSRDKATAKSDQALEGLLAWADQVRKEVPARKLHLMDYTTKDMVQWFEGQEEYEDNPVLSNGRRLGKYFSQKKNTVAQICGIIPTNKSISNYQVYKVSAIDEG